MLATNRRLRWGCSGLLALLVLTIMGLVAARGSLFRLAVCYVPSKTRHEGGSTLVESDLTRALDQWSEGHQEADVEELVDQGLIATAQQLHFVVDQTASDVNGIANTGRAHCVGYTRLYCAVTTHLLRQRGLGARYRCDHMVAHIHLFGVDIHPLFDNQFLADHDYARVIDLQTGASLVVDPSAFDYLGIRRVREGGSGSL